MDSLLKKICDIHDVDCNQKYDKTLPYSFHLMAVLAQVDRHIGCIKVPNFCDGELQYDYQFRLHEKLRRAAAGHDLIEDARMTFNDVKDLLGEEIADIIYACTEEKGKNRFERHSQKFFDELKVNRLAVFIKLCDIMANVLYSMLKNSSMYEKYKEEFPNLKQQLYVPGEYDKLWEDLEKLLC